MTVQEIHIDIDQKLQKVDSALLDSFGADEKDWWFHEGQTRYIWQRINAKLNAKKEGHQDTTKRLDDLADLIVPDYSLLGIVGTGNQYVSAVLPANYLMLISDASELQWNCNGLTLATTANSYFVATVPFPTGLQGNLDTVFYENLSLTLGKTVGMSSSEVTLFNLASYPYYEEGLQDVDESFYIINLILEATKNNSQNLEFYWEKYGDIKAENSFIIVCTGAYTPDYIHWELDGVEAEEYLFTEIDDTETVYVASETLTTRTSANRMVKLEDLRQILAHPFAKTKYDNPVSTIKDDRIYVYQDSTFRVLNILIDYYRKPRRISHRLDLTCELNPNRHSEIVDVTVQLMLAHLGHENYRPVAAADITHE